MDEYFDTEEIEGVTYAIEKDFAESYRPMFIYECIKHSFMSSDKNREKLADLLFNEEFESLVTKPVIRKGLELVIADLPELSMDHPAAPKKVGQLCAKAVNDSFYSFKEAWPLFDAHIEEGRGNISMCLFNQYTSSKIITHH